MLADTRWDTLREAAAVIRSGTHGFGTAGDEAAFSQLAGGLLEELAVQFAVRHFASGERRSAAIVAALNEAAFAFATRAEQADVDASCDCYHDDLHDFSGCRQKDAITGDFCECRAVTGAVEAETPAAVEEQVRDQYDALADGEWEPFVRVAGELDDDLVPLT